MTKSTIANIHIDSITPLISPQRLKERIPATPEIHQEIIKRRGVIQNILSGRDKRLLVIVGPCSIHHKESAYEYAAKLRELADKVSDKLFLVMRTYFEKPRTITGWRGLITDPYLDGSYDMEKGLHEAREVLLEVSKMGLACASELLDPIVPQYIDDLISWVAIGARTTESQTHRSLASGLSMPVGFKNGTGGNTIHAINAILAARHPAQFIGINDQGDTVILRTTGNPYGHLILRGGDNGPNYSPEAVHQAEVQLEAAGIHGSIIVDCSHANSNKRFQNQSQVFNSVIAQRHDGNDSIVGCMIESNISEGSQKVLDPKDLAYGVSITDGCIGWDETERIILEGYKQL